MVSTSQDGKLIVWDAFTTNKEVCIIKLEKSKFDVFVFFVSF